MGHNDASTIAKWCLSSHKKSLFAKKFSCMRKFKLTRFFPCGGSASKNPIQQNKIFLRKQEAQQDAKKRVFFYYLPSFQQFLQAHNIKRATTSKREKQFSTQQL